MKSAVLISAATVGAGALVVAWIIYRRKRQIIEMHPAEDGWQLIGSLKGIDMYPVKSCGAVELSEAKCDQFGLFWHGFRDRRLVVVNAEGKLCFAGVYPSMLSIKAELTADRRIMRLSAPRLPALTLDLNDVMGQVKRKQMKGYWLPLVECRPEHHEWFSRAILGKQSGLTLHIVLDPVVEQCWWRSTKPEISPFMVMHTKSLYDLNQRLSPVNQAHPQQFRGNLLLDTVDGIPPYDEDNWQWLKIGDDAKDSTVMCFQEPCNRCIIPNIDVNTCKRNKDYEPLRTLKTYRLRGHPKEPELGVYFDLYKAGQVHVGDPVYVQYKELK